MAKAYSDDLRQKLIEAHQQGDGSLPVLAQRFHVSVGWARKVSAAFYRSKFTEEIRRQLSEWIDEQPDLSLQQLPSRLRGELGLKASIGRLWSVLREMGLRLKTSRSTPPSRMLPPSRGGARSGVNR